MRWVASCRGLIDEQYPSEKRELCPEFEVDSVNRRARISPRFGAIGFARCPPSSFCISHADLTRRLLKDSGGGDVAQIRPSAAFACVAAMTTCRPQWASYSSANTHVSIAAFSNRPNANLRMTLGANYFRFVDRDIFVPYIHKSPLLR